MATSLAPYSLLSQHIPPIIFDGVEHLEEYGSYSAIHSDTFTSWRLVEPLLAGLVQLDRDGRSGLGRPTRIELFMGADTFRTRGLALFDQTGRLIVHVVNALVGYEGSGPYLTWQILEFLGVSKEMFEEIQKEADQTHGVVSSYRLVVLRSDDDKWTWYRAE